MRRLIAVLICVLAPSALAVSTSHWTQDGEADFKAGTMHNVVVTNLGDVKLSRELKTLLDEDPKVSMVTALAQGKDGTIYAGTAPQGVLLQMSGDKIEPPVIIDDTVSITALLAEPDGGLLVGASGARGRVLRIAKPGDKPREIFAGKDVQYIWGLVELPDGTIYAATGPNGQLFAIHPDGKSEEIYKSDENNLTAIVSDGHDLLYLGSDPDGLVIRLNRLTKQAFVMYNADEEEITALALDADGNLYAATGEEITPPQAQPSAAQTKEESGRPETGGESPLPSQPPTPPQPPEQPKPSPGQPPAIPQNSRTRGVLPANMQPLYLVTSADEPPDGQPGPDQPTPPDSQPAPTIGTDDSDASKSDKTAAPDNSSAKSEGNAIYKIDREGFVTEIFREDVVIYAMLEEKGVLLIGTGADGEIYQVNPAAEETVVVAKTDAKQVTSLLRAADGRIILGLSNTGGLAAMTDGYAVTGTYTSPVLDATQVSRFGVIQTHGFLPKQTTLAVSTRGGNVKDPDAQGWTPWSPDVSAQEFLRVATPPARFLQYRFTFGTVDPAQTPVVKDVDVSYQLPHLAPVIKSIKITDAQTAAAAAAAAGQPAPPAPKPDNTKSGGTGVQVITWDFSDLDNDNLTFSLYFRLTTSDDWILLKDKLTDPTFSWDTRTVADGRYEVKVVASDAAANPPGDGKTASRISEALVVDNTPPVIGDLRVTEGAHSVKISLRVADETSTVASMDYSVDSNDAWQALLPVDNIFDEREEVVIFTISDLAPGPHQISLRAADARGNIAYQTVTVTVGNAK